MAWWDFHNPVHIRFGAGRLAELAHVIETESVVLITTKGMTQRGTTAAITKLLARHECAVFDTVESNPSIESLERDANALIAQRLPPARGPATFVAVGGGSAIDSAKVLSLIPTAADSGLTILDLLDLPDRVASIDAAPVIAIPTTAGTGSEMTPFATVWDHRRHVKRSIASPKLYPSVALLDPELTGSLPRLATISSGLDAISQGFEAIWNRHATPVTNELACRAIYLGVTALPTVVQNPSDLSARETMLEASMLSGLAISQTRTALTHAMSYPMTAHYGLPHGVACAFTLPALLSFNSCADDGRLLAVARRFGCESLVDLREILVRLLQTLGMDDILREVGITRRSLTAVLHEMVHPGRSDNNIRPAGPQEIEQIILDTGSYLPVLRN